LSNDDIVRIDFKFLAERLLGFLHFADAPVFRSQFFVEAGFTWGELNGRLVFGNRIHVAVSISISLRENLPDTPGFRIRPKHARITVFGDEQMRLAAVVENIHIRGSKFRGFV